MSDFQTVKSYLQEMNLNIVKEIPEEEIIIIDDESNGIKSLVVDCEDSILIFEQAIFKLSGAARKNPDFLMRLLQMNRELVHGAFVIADDGNTVLFRDTLQLANLDYNEVEGSINALALGLAEFSDEIIKFARA